ncbi:MAG: S9 family peptidase [Phycisphaeraceae bacterium]|nr:MAG: S9 family peptidase [Phycisphaeraceae bacterium]
MSHRTFALHLAAVFSASCLVVSTAMSQVVYPDSARVDHVDTYHGKQIPDPYKWLEDPDTPESRRWINAQNEVTFGVLNGIASRDRIKSRMTELWNYERFGVPFKEGGRYFYSRNDGLQPQSVLYVADSLTSEPRVLLDPNTFSADGTVALSGYSVSEDGRYIAYGVSEGGSDWQTWRVRDIATGQDLEDVVRWVKFSSASWRKDGSGFYYTRYDEPTGNDLTDVNQFPKVYLHTIGEDQSRDRLVYKRDDQPEWGFASGVTDDGRYLAISVWWGTRQENNFFYQDLADPASSVVELLTGFDASYTFVGNDGPEFYFVTTLDAPRGRLIAIDTTRPSRDAWREIIPQQPENLRGVSYVGGHFLAQYLKDAKTLVRVHDVAGRFAREVSLPGIGSAGGFGGKPGDPETFYAFTSYTNPGAVYRYDVKSGASEVFRQPKFNADLSGYETRQVFYTSKDGTRVPMFITSKKGLKLDGNNPTLLYGYGGFNIPLTPGFSPATVVWLEMGGIYAVANIRGGGEYGKEWHEAGIKLKKQNVFDDFIAAAEYLVDQKYTSPKRLAIQGGSNGGLLVGACMTQRPDLFGACIPQVGVLDMLRFESFTIGWAWTSDFGSVKNEDEFHAMLAYSPYHNTKPGTSYPATLITTGDHDDRVVPAHSFKFAAALQNAQGGDAPVLIRIETRGGHGAGKPTAMIIEERSDILGFISWALGMEESEQPRSTPFAQ